MHGIRTIRRSSLCPALITGLFAVALLSPDRLSAQTRPIQLDDWLGIKTVGDFTVAPDAQSAVFVLREVNRKKDRRDASLWRVALAGGTPQRLTFDGNVSGPRFSPDGKLLAYVSDRYSEPTGMKKPVAEAGQVWILPLAGGEAFPVTALRSGVESFEWAPDSRRIALLSRDPRPEPDKTDNDEEVAPPIVLTRLQHKRDEGGYLDSRRRHLYVASLEPALASPGTMVDPKPVTSGPFDASDPAWSPDGQSIVFSSNRTGDADANENTDLWLVSAAGGDVTRLTSDPGSDGAPVWSPDGKSIAYIHMPLEPAVYATPRLLVIPASGGPPRDLTGRFDRHAGGPPRWTPDGTAVLVALEDDGRRPLLRVSLSGQRLVLDEGDVGGFEIRGDHVVVSKTTPTRPTELYVLSGSGQAARRLTEMNEPLFRQLAFNPAENIHARSADGTPVEGWVVKPPQFDPTGTYPLVLRIHGGPVDQFTDAFSFEHQYLASLGYVVVFANPRGSNGYGEAFCKAIFADWGNKDLQDVMGAIDHVIAQGYADREKLGVGGWSYGGILTNYLVTKSTRFKAAISGASETDMFSAYGVDDLQIWWRRELGLPWRNLELYRKLSPIMDVEKIVTPTLLMVGDKDYRVPLPQSEQLYVALKALGKETGLVIYPGQNHGISRPSYQIDRLRRYGLWYDKYLRGKDVDPLYDRAIERSRDRAK